MIRTYQGIIARIKILESRLAELELTRDCLSHGEGQSRGGGISDPTAQTATEIIDMIRRIDTLRAEAEREKQSVIETLNRMQDGDEMMILYKRYVERKPWRVIARETYMSESTLYRKHDSGLKHFEEQEEEV